MYGFPTQLFPIPQGMFDDQSIGFGTGIDRQIFYSVKDGNWSDMSVWETVSGKVGRLPTANDDVYIRYGTAITADITASVNNLGVSGTIKGLGGPVISVFGNFKSTGLVDFTGSTITVILYGLNNYVDNFICGSSTISYMQTIPVNIMPLLYNHLTSIASVNRSLISDVITNGNLTTGFGTAVTFELGNFNLIVNGATSNRLALSKVQGGSIIFKGFLNSSNGDSDINFSGNPTIEFQGGVLFANNRGFNNFGTGLISVTTNNQNFSLFSITTFTDLIIYAGIVLTVSGGNSPMSILNSITGATSTSKLVNSGWIRFYCTTWMTTGIFDYLTNPNTIGFMMSGDFIIPYTLMWSMETGGGGSKFLSGDTVLQGSLNSSGSNLDFANHNLTVNGISTIWSLSNPGTSIIFIGRFTGRDTSFGTVDIECRGGIYFNAFSVPFTANRINLTTNNQDLDSTDSNTGQTPVINALILIKGAITVTYGNHLPTFSGVIFSFQLNGDNASSTFVSKLSGPSRYAQYRATLQPMATGILDCNSFANTWAYDLSGDQEIKGTTYRTLIFGGSGVKKLMGNVVVNTTAGGSWSITGGATIDYNGFTITTI